MERHIFSSSSLHRPLSFLSVSSVCPLSRQLFIDIFLFSSPPSPPPSPLPQGHLSSLFLPNFSSLSFHLLIFLLHLHLGFFLILLLRTSSSSYLTFLFISLLPSLHAFRILISSSSFSSSSCFSSFSSFSSSSSFSLLPSCFLPTSKLVLYSQPLQPR